MNAPPLEMFPQASASLDDSFVTETEPEETDLDTSFCFKTGRLQHSKDMVTIENQ